MKIRKRSHLGSQTSLQMTAMIDIVFLLLVFFVMTFKVVVPEGDFNLKLPVTTQGDGAPPVDVLPPIRIHLRADASGALTGIQLNETGFGTDFDAVRSSLMSIVGPERGVGSIAETAEVEIESDYGLRYEYIIATMTAISGYRADDGSIVRAIEKIKLTPPAAPAT